MPVDTRVLQQGAKRLTQKSRSNFYFSFLFLPKEKREAIYSVYAFCRHSDDLADQDIPAERRMEQLDAWRGHLDACYEGRADTPVLQALARTVERFHIPKVYFEELIRGVEMDLTRCRYRTFDELYPYCYRVASVVGLICIEIFGYRNPRSREFAEHLGVALQLTNILRDVGADGERDRIYLPQEDLERFGLSESDLLSRRYDEVFIRLMAYEADRAESYYGKAYEALPPEDRPNMLAAEIMGAIYHLLLERIRSKRFDVFHGKVSVSDWRKFLLAFRLWAGNGFRA
ncbi:MAG: presqualene diphosphate synthase HpnD [Planctomycetes bacterium]|nr:presqualene diphosphate synthase HpnD [Planctomycetota bacterium]